MKPKKIQTIPQNLKFVPEKDTSMWTSTSMWTKLLCVAIVCVILYLIVQKIQKAKLSKPTKPTKHNKHDKHNATNWYKTPQSLPQSYSKRIHIGIHVYRCDPTPVAQTLFGIYEGAMCPENVHVYIYQELQLRDGWAIDGVGLYRKEFLKHHKNPKIPKIHTTNIHVKNINAQKSQGPLVGLLVLGQDMILPNLLSIDDVAVFTRPFFEHPKTTDVYGLTLVQGYDVGLAKQILTHGILSTRLPRSSAQIREHIAMNPKVGSLVSAVMNTMALPTLTAKMNRIEVVASHVCTKGTWDHLLAHQAGFVAFTTLDKEMRPPGIFPRTKPSAKVPIPFATFRYLNDTHFVQTQINQTNQKKNKKQLMAPLPMVGLHEDLQVMDGGMLQRVITRAGNYSAQLVRAVPYHAYTLVLSNLCYMDNIGFYSMNHVPFGVVLDHETGLSPNSTPSPKSIQHVLAFRPKYWRMLPRKRQTRKSQTQRNGNNGNNGNNGKRKTNLKRKEREEIVDMVPAKDIKKVLPISVQFSWYANRLTADQISVDTFLGITAVDIRSTLGMKFGTPENLSRRRRMLGIDDV